MDAAVIGCEVAGALRQAERGLVLAREIGRDLLVAGSREVAGSGDGGAAVLERLWRGR